jgi:hypothetical protein
MAEADVGFEGPTDVGNGKGLRHGFRQGGGIAVVVRGEDGCLGEDVAAASPLEDDRMSILLVTQEPDGPAPDDMEPVDRIAAVEDGGTRRENPLRSAKMVEQFG